MNYYERHIGDYLKDTAHLSLLEHGVYARLMDVYYTRESALEATEAARLIGARSKEEKAAVASVLAEFFKLVDGLHHQARCDAEIERYQRKAAHNREVGKLGGRPKKTETQTKPVGFSAGSKTEPEQNPLQTPDTRHQTPKSREGARGSRLPLDWAPDDELCRFAGSVGVRSVDELPKFRDYWAAQPGQKGVKTDWAATWRNWCRNARTGKVNGKPPDDLDDIFRRGAA